MHKLTFAKLQPCLTQSVKFLSLLFITTEELIVIFKIQKLQTALSLLQPHLTPCVQRQRRALPSPLASNERPQQPGSRAPSRSIGVR